MMMIVNIVFCLIAFAATFAALVQVGASRRAFGARWQRWVAVVGLVIWLGHCAITAMQMIDGVYVETWWTAARWFANAAIGIVLIKILARFDALTMDQPMRSALFSARSMAK